MKVKRLCLSIIICCVLLGGVDLTPAQTWIQTDIPTNFWSSIACSADGSKLIAVAGHGKVLTGPQPCPIYISTNYGATWYLADAPSNRWSQVTASADFENLAAVAVPMVYTSTNAGLTWVSNNVPNLGAPSLSGRWFTCSADGSKFFTTSILGSLYISTNFGMTWTTNAILHQVETIASSADGTKLIAAQQIGSIFLSTNSGVTWVTNPSPIISPMGQYYSVASSANGCKLVLAAGSGANYGNIYTSSNSGATWISNNIPLFSWQYVAMSADGNKLIAAAWRGSGNQTGPIYTSTNSGLSWVSNDVPNLSWQGVTMSADGNRLAAVAITDENRDYQMAKVWLSSVTPSPCLKATLCQTNLLLSWTVPSTNFVLQYNPDLTSPNWEAVTNIPMLNFTNLHDEAWLCPSGNNSYFRLIAQ